MAQNLSPKSWREPRLSLKVVAQSRIKLRLRVKIEAATFIQNHSSKSWPELRHLLKIVAQSRTKLRLWSTTFSQNRRYDFRPKSFFQRLSVTIQRYNAIAFPGTFLDVAETGDFFERNSYFLFLLFFCDFSPDCRFRVDTPFLFCIINICGVSCDVHWKS